nr:methylenetetrahydrofolate reductase [Bradyrhizobium sp. WSM3983]
MPFLNGYSLEITSGDVHRLQAARKAIASGTPVSITFLPGDEVDNLARTAGAVRRLGYVPIPHISARRITSHRELFRFLSDLKDEAAVERVFVIAGDPPRPLGPYGDALAIINTGLLADFGIRHVGIAGYPTGHPQISSTALTGAMTDKLGAIARSGQTAEIVTQFSFDSEDVLSWLLQIRRLGVNATVRIGIPGPASVKSLIRFAARCGVESSANVFAKYGISIRRLLSTATPDLLVNNLARQLDPVLHGAVKAHLYPFGGVEKLSEWIAAFSASNSVHV